MLLNKKYDVIHTTNSYIVKYSFNIDFYTEHIKILTHFFQF